MAPNLWETIIAVKATQTQSDANVASGDADLCLCKRLEIAATGALAVLNLALLPAARLNIAQTNPTVECSRLCRWKSGDPSRFGIIDVTQLFSDGRETVICPWASFWA
jgi:hypothetical protein